MMMRRTLGMGVVMAVLTLGLSSAGALTAESGHAATLLFDESDVAALSDWSDLNVVSFAAPNGPGVGDDAVAIDSAGRVYAVIRGYDDFNDVIWYDGIARVAGDGTNLETLDRFAWDWEDVTGTGWVSYGDIRGMTVASVRVPSTGALEERLVVVGTGKDLGGNRFLGAMAYELSTGGDGVFDAEALFSLDAVDGQFSTHLAVDSSTGTVYLMNGMPGTAETHDGSIRAFGWSTSSSEYLESSQPVTSAQVGYRDLAFHGGYLYTFDLANRASSSRTDPILQVDPSGTDITSSYASMRQANDTGSYYGWASSGSTFYIAEWITRKRRASGEVTVITSGQTTSSDDRIATFGTDSLHALGGAGDGSVAAITSMGVYLLAPGGSSGGGGGGNGGGKGKGKPK